MLKEARIEERDGKLALALRRLSRGLSLLRDVPGPEAAAARSMLANRYAFCRNRQGRYTDALRWGAVSVQEAQDSADIRALATSYRAMQIIHLWAGVPEDLPYGQLALHAFEELGDLDGQALSLNNLAVRAFFEGRWTESLAMYHRAADNFERIGDVARLGSTSYNVADVLIAQGRLAEAEPLLQKALVAARASGDEELVALVAREARQGMVARGPVRGGPGVARPTPGPASRSSARPRRSSTWTPRSRRTSCCRATSTTRSSSPKAPCPGRERRAPA